MLRSLSIQNFALIDTATIDFSSGYTVITGETGSGKSILLGALNLILGERSDFSMIRNTEKKTVVEAIFEISADKKKWFEQEDIDWEEPTVIRREITSQGKSRAFINDTPVQLSQLKELTESLISIHSQHQTLALKNKQFQLDLVDSFSKLTETVQHYRAEFRQFQTLKNRLSTLQQTAQQQQQESDYLQFQLAELQQLDISQHNFESYEQELNRIDQLDNLRVAFHALSTDIMQDNSTFDQLQRTKIAVEKWASADATLASLVERFRAALLEIKDISDEAESELEKLEASPERQAELTVLLDKYYQLLRKHNLGNQEELQSFQQEIEAKLESGTSMELEIEELRKAIETNEIELHNQATQIHSKRVVGSHQLAEELIAICAELKLNETKLIFDWETGDNMDANGISRINLLFSANAGLEAKTIEKTASGGEISRLMLAIQYTLSKTKQLPTLILDEIDTGVSGDVAFRIGKLLAQMGNSMQCLAITHLPQVAAKAQQHLEVSKSSVGEQTNTTIRQLNAQEHIEAVAKLMSGTSISEVSIANAQLLVDSLN